MTTNEHDDAYAADPYAAEARAMGATYGHDDVLLAIFDTRDPEGNGMAMRDEKGELILFGDDAMARSWLASKSISPSCVIIAPYDDAPDDYQN